MNTRLPEAKRIQLEARYQALREVAAALEPGKVSGIVDKVGPEQADIQGVIVSIMKLMDAEGGIGSYHTASIKTLLKKAYEMADAGENPESEAMDFKDPAMHMAEDLEHEVQTMDDHRLIQEVQQLEQHMKEDLAKLPGGSSPAAAPAPHAAPAAAPMAPPAPAPHAAPVAPKSESPFPPKGAESPDGDTGDSSFPPKKKESTEKPEAKKEAPAKDESSEESEDDEKDDKPEMKAEARLALLMSLPKEKKLAKAASLRALAGVLESDVVPVSQDNEMNEVGTNPELKSHYESQGEGSMKDVKAAALKSTVRELLAALEEEKEDDKKEDDKEMDKEAVLKLALRHLHASIEDMQEAKDDEDDDSEEDKEPSMEERKAILKARLASMKRTATVDGKSMKTPKEVPSPSGTTEDNLKGDAKIQYSTTSGEEGLDVINDRRTPNKKDKQVAGNDEPNSLYSSNNPAKDRYEPTTESDSSKDVNNKRVLKDMGEAVQNSAPTSPTDHMEMGSGSHQKEKSWEKAKSESDTTPTGDRLVGLAGLKEIIKTRTDRAVKLAGQMAGLGLIKTESQLGEKIAELASMDDDLFTSVASFLNNSITKDTSVRRPGKTAGELPPWLDKDKDGEPDVDENEEDDDSEEESEKKEAGLVRRASKSNTRRAERGGLKTPLMSGTESLINQRASTISRNGNGNSISDALKGLAWTDPKVEARKKLSDLDEIFDGSGYTVPFGILADRRNTTVGIANANYLPSNVGNYGDESFFNQPGMGNSLYGTTNGVNNVIPANTVPTTTLLRDETATNPNTDSRYVTMYIRGGVYATDQFDGTLTAATPGTALYANTATGQLTATVTNGLLVGVVTAPVDDSMATPIQTSLLYQSIGRKLLVVDPLPQGALARYEKDIDVPATLISKRGQAPDVVIEGADFLVPTWEITSYPQIRLSQVKQRMFNIIDRAQVKAKNEISVQEDTQIFKAIDFAVPADPVNAAFNHLISTASGRLTLDLVNAAFAKIEKHRLTVSKVVLNSQRFADIRAWGKDYFDFVTQREVLLTGVFGRLWTSELLISNLVPDNSVLVLAPAEFVGVMPVRQEITVIPADKPSRLRLGWVVYQEIGVAVVNPKGVSKITVN
ncbi:unnamed protein product [Sphagnum jensenii]|uniref:Major capsid protein n=1 Tax=Sphagnum jensenii TaxID=128206 RepID=A0ABP0VCQ8_9BRYO